MQAVLVTPTWLGDLERFALMRESISTAEVLIPHHVCVQTEHLAAFKARFAGRPEANGIEWSTTADVLPPEIEARRLRRAQQRAGQWKKIQRSLQKRFGWFALAAYEGWQTQQLVKLELARRLGPELIITIDSDVVVTRAFTAADFQVDGRIALPATSRTTVEADAHTARWNDQGCALQGLQAPLTFNGGHYLEIVQHPFPFERSFVQRLCDQLEQQSGKFWMDYLLAQPVGNWSEFTLYGYAALQSENPPPMVEVNAATRWLYTEADFTDIGQNVASAFADPKYQFLVVQAHRHFPASEYEALIHAQLDV